MCSEVSLYNDDDGYSLVEVLVDAAPSVEEQAAADELTQRIMRAIDSLPEAQRITVYYRFIRDLSIDQVAKLTNQPSGSVKSKSYYGIQKVRRMLSDFMTEGESTMSCKEAYALLYQHAQGLIMPDDREKVENHLAICKLCSSVDKSLRLLAPHITPAMDREVRHFMIAIPLDDGMCLSYFGITVPMDDYKRMNTVLKERNGTVPQEENWFNGGHDADFEHLAEFDNEGHRIEFELVPNPNYRNNVRVKYQKMTKVYPNHTRSSVGLRRSRIVTSALEDPDLMIGKLQNNLGCSAKSGLYLAIPASAKNIRIKRGNGVIDAGDYEFAFSERYITEDEVIRLECSYLS